MMTRTFLCSNIQSNMPKAKAAADVKIKQVIPHCQFSGSKVVYLQLDRRPPDSILEILREHGFYRRGPGGAGWHIPIKQVKACSKALSAVWKVLGDRVLECARFIQQHPEQVVCPSRGQTPRSKSSGKAAKYTKVQKVG